MKIVAAAIMHGMQAWSLEPPARHHDVMRSMWEAGIQDPGKGEQGFLTEHGEFVGRREAAIIARNAGQIGGRKRTDPQDQLFSEDLW